MKNVATNYHHEVFQQCSEVLQQTLKVKLFVQFIQKKDPTYQEVKDETTWSMARFNDYVNMHYAKDHGLGMEWVYTTLHVSSVDNQST